MVEWVWWVAGIQTVSIHHKENTCQCKVSEEAAVLLPSPHHFSFQLKEETCEGRSNLKNWQTVKKKKNLQIKQT